MVRLFIAATYIIKRSRDRDPLERLYLAYKDLV